LLESGLSPQEALDSLLAADEERGKRQVGIVDAAGRSASFTGGNCFDVAASLAGPNYACQGNILTSGQVVPAMAEAFESTSGPLAERLIEALRAAQQAGGEQRGMESAGLLVYKPNGGYGGNHDRYIDLRVDHDDDPIEKLALLLDLHRLYLQRPAESDLLTVDPPLEAEIRGHLEKLGKAEPGADLWEALEDYMGWENLEERWGGRGRIDPKVLAYLREQAG
jgi:uncharacterized Ntn-hydrolase superfamily protein